MESGSEMPATPVDVFTVPLAGDDTAFNTQAEMPWTVRFGSESGGPK